MNNFEILENNLFFRIFVGLNSIIIGFFLLILYLQRDKKNTWGQMYSCIYESMKNFAKLGQAEKMLEPPYDKFWLLLAIFGLFAGIMIIFFGFG